MAVCGFQPWSILDFLFLLSVPAIQGSKFDFKQFVLMLPRFQMKVNTGKRAEGNLKAASGSKPLATEGVSSDDEDEADDGDVVDVPDAEIPMGADRPTGATDRSMHFYKWEESLLHEVRGCHPLVVQYPFNALCSWQASTVEYTFGVTPASQIDGSSEYMMWVLCLIKVDMYGTHSPAVPHGDCDQHPEVSPSRSEDAGSFGGGHACGSRSHRSGGPKGGIKHQPPSHRIHISHPYFFMKKAVIVACFGPPTASALPFLCHHNTRSPTHPHMHKSKTCRFAGAAGFFKSDAGVAGAPALGVATTRVAGAGVAGFPPPPDGAGMTAGTSTSTSSHTCSVTVGSHGQHERGWAIPEADNKVQQQQTRESIRILVRFVNKHLGRESTQG